MKSIITLHATSQALAFDGEPSAADRSRAAAIAQRIADRANAVRAG